MRRFLLGDSLGPSCNLRQVCTFITATIRGSISPEFVNSLFPKDWRSFEFCNNPFVLVQLPPGTIYLRHTGNWCDCGTAMGAGLERD